MPKPLKSGLYKRICVYTNYGHYREDTGTDFKGTRAELFEAYSKTVYELYTTSTERTKAQRESFTMENAEQEMVADFVGDVILAADGNFDKTEATLKEIANTNRSFLQRFKDFVTELINKLKGYPNNKTLTEDLEYLKDRLVKVYDSAANKKAAQKSGEKNSIKEIIGISGTNYGIGVYLDSNLLTGLTSSERKEMLKEFVLIELSGKHFIAYDNNSAVDIKIAHRYDNFKNETGKNRSVLKELYNKHNDLVIKQEAVVLIDELIAKARYDSSASSTRPHGELDNNGKNDWDYWKVFIQEKNKTVWEATLNIANTANGEKILYDIDPIKKVEEAIESASITTKVEAAIKSATTTTNNIIYQNDTKSQEKNSLRKDPPHKAPTDYAKKILRNNGYYLSKQQNGFDKPLRRLTKTLKVLVNNHCNDFVANFN